VKEPSDDFLTLPELAKWVGIDSRTIKEKIVAGELPDGIRIKPKGNKRWDKNRCAVIQWVLSHPEAFRKRRVNSAKPRKTAQNPYKTEQNLETEKS
jgi:predicted DNA-binding transcriptional regulator AlpA